MNSTYRKLEERGFIHQCTDEGRLEKALEEGPVSFYAGFDPTADSLHVGHLLPVMAMRHLQDAGHVPIVLVGGATALIGDPSGKKEERPVIEREIVEANAGAIRKQLGNFMDASEKEALFVNNIDWFGELGFLDFMRKIGPMFTVNKMLSAESVKSRLETGISYLEFSYSLLQAYDFYMLNKKHGCRLQVGGQDQWGNIVAGTELTRRLGTEEPVFGLTFPLLTNSSGEKFGKTAAGAVWLDPAKTPVFEYYQFWRNTVDENLECLLLLFTMLDTAEVKELVSGGTEKHINRAKEILAYEATALAHGEEAAAEAYLSAGYRFGFADPDAKIPTGSRVKNVRTGQAKSSIPSFQVPENELKQGIWIVKLLADSGLCSSNGEARRLIKAGGAYLNDERVTSADLELRLSDLADGQAILRSGKKNIRRIVV